MAELKKVTSSSFSVSDGGGEQVAGRKKGGYGKKGKGAGSRIPKVAGRRRNRGTMWCHTIFCNQQKHKEAGANKKRVGTGIKGNGKGEV